MSIFGSSSSAICPDYFGDEFGLPLPQNSMVKNKATTTRQSTELGGNSRVAKVVLFDGKNIVSTNRLPMEQTRESKCGAPTLAPNFDGLHCFETFVLY